jgi:hypothetical protein
VPGGADHDRTKWLSEPPEWAVRFGVILFVAAYAAFLIACAVTGRWAALGILMTAGMMGYSRLFLNSTWAVNRNVPAAAAAHPVVVVALFGVVAAGLAAIGNTAGYIAFYGVLFAAEGAVVWWVARSVTRRQMG